MSGMSAVELRFELPASPEVVFDHLVDIDLLITWWPTSGETDPRPGGSYRLHWAGADATLRGEYRIVERPTKLEFTWRWDHDGIESVVTFDLAPVGAGTRLDVVQTAGSDQERDDYIAGWEHFIGVLVERLAH